MITIKYYPLSKMSDHNESMVINMMEAINDLNLADFVINFNGDGGFMFSNDERVTQIGNHRKVLQDGHSGCSFAITARECQRRFKNTSYNYKNYFNNQVQSVESIEIRDNNEVEAKPINYNNDIVQEKKINNYIKVEAKPIKGAGSSYLLYESMDDNNKEVMDVMAIGGHKAAFDMMTEGVRNGTMTYAEMRSRWG